MAHPAGNHLRNDKVERSRVSGITAACGGGGMASGGHADVNEDKALVRKMVRKTALRASGGAVKARSDRPARAWGGRSPKKSRKSAKTSVNVIVGAHHPPIQGGIPNLPGVAGPLPGAPPGLGAKPPMAMPTPGPVPPGASSAVPGMPPPGGAPPMLPPGQRMANTGGRMYKKGGAVFSGSTAPAFTTKGKNKSADGNNEDATSAGLGKGRTPIRHARGKQDGENIGRGPVITKATGGPVVAPREAHAGMGPKPPGGGGGGKFRKWETARYKAKGYGNSTRNAENPNRDPKP